MKIYSDGFTIGSNPSKVGGGYVVMNENMEILAMHEVRKENFTNNEAELLGAAKAMELAEEYDTVITDSMNTYWWITRCKVKARPDLLPIVKQAKTYLLDKQLEFRQEPRENNLAGNYIEFTLQK